MPGLETVTFKCRQTLGARLEAAGSVMTPQQVIITNSKLAASRPQDPYWMQHNASAANDISHRIANNMQGLPHFNLSHLVMGHTAPSVDLQIRVFGANEENREAYQLQLPEDVGSAFDSLSILGLDKKLWTPLFNPVTGLNLLTFDKDEFEMVHDPGASGSGSEGSTSVEGRAFMLQSNNNYVFASGFRRCLALISQGATGIVAGCVLGYFSS